MKKVVMGFMFVFIAFLFISIQVFAKPKIKNKIVYKKNTIINFKDGIVDGELIKPHGGFVQSRVRAKFNSLIIYRKDFLDKMIKQAKKL